MIDVLEQAHGGRYRKLGRSHLAAYRPLVKLNELVAGLCNNASVIGGNRCYPEGDVPQDSGAPRFSAVEFPYAADCRSQPSAHHVAGREWIGQIDLAAFDPLRVAR